MPSPMPTPPPPSVPILRAAGRAAGLLLPPLAVLATCLALAGCAEPPATTVAYVAVGGNNHVAVVDLTAGEVVGKVYSGTSPWRLALAPDGDRLWVQNWYSGTTAVVDLEDHTVAGTLPFRGPGAFVPRPAEGSGADGGADGGESYVFLTAHWPERVLTTVDPASLEVGGEEDTEIKEIYDLAPFGHEGGLLMAQYDPMARGPAPRYGYALSYHWEPGGDATTAPVSHPVGPSPVRVVPVPDQPFFLTADVGSDGISLVNQLGDARSLAVCPAPREITLSPAADRVAVLCWLGRGAPRSQVVLFAADFTARPWPSLDRLAEVEVEGGLVAADFTADGRLLAVDQSGGRLLVLDAGDLRQRAEIAVGDHPTDVVATALSAERLRRAAEPPPQRRRLLAALERLSEQGAPFRDMAWTETATWLEKPADDMATEGGDEDADGTDEETPAVERHRSLHMALQPPDDLRSEGEDGSVRLAAGGWVVTLDAAGRFWVTPRQEMLATVLALPAMSADEALRHLAGDVPGRPFLSSGLAVDVGTEVTDDSGHHLVVGAGPEGARVSQLWIDLESGHPANLVETFPVFGPGGHGGAPPGVVETKLEDFAALGEGAPGDGSGPLLPQRLQRVVEGTWLQQVRLDAAVADRGLPPHLFDATRLGGAEPTAALFTAAALAALAAPADTRPAAVADRPGRAVALQLLPAAVSSPMASYPPYDSSPPTSGAYMPWAADAGVYPLPVPLPLQAHALLDGGVALQYDCPEGCPDLVAELAAVAASHDGVLVAPYPWLPAGSRLALTAWGRMELLDAFDGERVEAFVAAWAGGDHHAELPAGGGLLGAH